jgi:hypothetical protein
VYWLAAVLIVAIVVGVVWIAIARQRVTGVVPTTTASPRATAADSEVPAWFSNLPFNCVGSTGLATGPAPALAYVNAVRAGTQAGFDRVTIQFADRPPANTVLTSQSGAKFTSGAGGQAVTLNGQYGAVVTMHNSDSHTQYGGQTDIKTGYPVVLELYKLQDSQGTVQWAIALSRMPCYRMAFLDNPTRLVIDFRAASATT